MNKDYKNLHEIKKIVDIDSKNHDEVIATLGGTKIHAVSVQKGGVGKSTLTSDIAYALANAYGFRVLVIDSDPQASLSELCNIDVSTDEVRGLQYIYDEMLSNNGNISLEFIKDLIITPKFNKPVKEGMKYAYKEEEFGFDLIPCDISLANYDIHLANNPYGAIMLYKALNLLVKANLYDYILIDVCPGLSTLAYNAIAASVDGILVPVNLEPMTIKGAKNLISVTTEIQELMEKNFKIVHKGILGIIKNQYVSRLKIQKKFGDIVETFFPVACFETTIPNKTVCDTAHDLGRLFSEYDPKVGLVFKELAKEIIELDIYRKDEKEPVYIKEFGEEIWAMINADKANNKANKSKKNDKAKQKNA